MIKTVVGCITVICGRVLLMPWLVDTGPPLGSSEVRSSRRLAIADFASAVLPTMPNDRIGTE